MSRGRLRRGDFIPLRSRPHANHISLEVEHRDGGVGGVLGVKSPLADPY